jgi:hypothetical protein
MHPLAAETIKDFVEKDGGTYQWYNRRIWEKEKLKRWVKDVTENGTLAKMKKFYESQGVKYQS